MIIYIISKKILVLIMSILVMKFGGASLSTPTKIKKVARIIEKRKRIYQKIVVIVSAMGDMTDKLLELSKKISINPHKREVDMLITAGERISMSLLAMALYERKIEAISFTGSQSGIITTKDHSEAKIIDIKPFRVIESLNENKVVIVAGFQGVSLTKEITTLGRGGSDTSAVALAAALGSKKVEFFKDVEGVYDRDPKKYLNAKKFDEMSYLQASNLMTKGAKVLHQRCVKLAEKNGIILHLLSFNNCKQNKGTIIKNNKAIKFSKILYE